MPVCHSNMGANAGSSPVYDSCWYRIPFTSYLIANDKTKSVSESNEDGTP